MFVYVIVCSESMKIYVGQHKGDDLQHYLQQKMYEARKRLKSRSHLYAALRKYPRETWSIHALMHHSTRDDLDYWERHFIRVLKTQHPDVGYNICDGGEGFTGLHSEKAKRKIGDKSRAWRASLTGQQRQEHNRKTGDAQKGKVIAPESIEKMRAALTGIAHTPEHCARQSQGIKAAITSGYTPHEFTPQERQKAKQECIAKLTGVPRPPEVLEKLHSAEAQEKAHKNSGAARKGKSRPDTAARKKKWWSEHPDHKFSLDRNKKISDNMKGRKPEAALRQAHSPAAEEKRRLTKFLKTVAWG